MNTPSINRRKTIYTRLAGFIAIIFICVPMIAQAGSWERVFAFLDRPARAERKERALTQEERREQQSQEESDATQETGQETDIVATNTSVNTARDPDATSTNTGESVEVEQATETGPVDTPSARTQGLEQLRARALELVRSMIARITDTKTRIESQERAVGSEDLTTEALTNLQSDIAYFTEEQSIIETAEDVTTIRGSIVEVRERVRERKTRMTGVRTRAQEKANNRVENAVATGERIVEKLRIVENKLEKKGLDTSRLTVLIDAHNTTVQNLRSLDVETDRDQLKEQINLLRTQMQTIVDAIQSLVQSVRTE